VNTPIETAFSWVRQIPGDLIALDEKPLIGFPPDFPWKNFAAALEKTFQIQGLVFQAEKWEWRSEKDLLSGIGETVKGFKLTVAPLTGNVWWGMPQQDILRLMNLLLSKDQGVAFEEIDREFFTAFYQFLAVEALSALESVNFDKNLTCTIAKEENLPSEACLCLDLSISVKEELFHGRLFLSNEFRRAWAQRYLKPKTALNLLSPVGNALDLLIHLEIGKVALKFSQWKEISIGDFLVLDSCSFDPKENKGRVMLVINSTPYFRGRIKQGNIKILEHPLYYEVNTSMDDSTGKEELDDDFNFDDEELNDIAEGEDLDIENGTPSKTAAPAAPVSTAAVPSKEIETEAPPSSSSTKIPSIEEIPLNIVVEVGRIQMSIKKLLELQAGNMLELNIHPEAGVDLVVNGKRIARGEILRIGDVLGVRVIEFS
jgi:flagellar motor switch protein FliN